MKLEIELVPESAFGANVRSAVPRAEWDRIRRETYRKAGYLCEVCGGAGRRHPVECHEVWEFDQEKLVQKLVGFVALCPMCHAVKHMGLASIRGVHEEALAHFAKVNGMSLAKAARAEGEAWRVWGERSCFKWRLDLSLIGR